MDRTSSSRLEPHVWRLASVVVLGSIMSILDATIVNIALETLSVELGSPLSTIQWIVTAYLLALAAVIPLTGWAARRLGMKRVYLLSLVLFTAGSALCGLAWSTGSLIAFRVLQGIGGGMLMPVGQMIIARAAGPQRMGRVMSILGVPIVLAPVVGPALGGLVLDQLSWRWLFFVNLPVGALAVVAGLRRLPADSARATAEPIDRLGLALLATGLTAVVFGLSELGARGGFDPVRVVAPAGIGAALVALFVLHARRAPKPLLDVRLFRNVAFSAAALTTFSVGAALFGGMILLPLYFQAVRGESALATGLMLAPQAIGVALSMPLAGRLTDTIGGGIVAIAGITLSVLGTLPLMFLSATTSYSSISIALVVRGFGMGATMMPAMAAAYKVLRHDQVTDAAPQLNVIQRVGGSIGTALFAVVLERHLRALGTGGDPASRASAYAATHWWVAGATVAGLVPAFLLARIERRSPAAHHAETRAGGEAQAESAPP